MNNVLCRNVGGPDKWNEERSIPDYVPTDEILRGKGARVRPRDATALTTGCVARPDILSHVGKSSSNSLMGLALQYLRKAPKPLAI